MMKEKLNSRKGFTLAELLIVVAIIAVLAAIAIPVFGAELEKAAEATDLANIRAAYAEVMVDAVSEPSEATNKSVTLKQTQADWQTDNIEQVLKDLVGDKDGTLNYVSSNPVSGGTATVTWVPTTTTGATTTEGHCTISFSSSES